MAKALATKCLFRRPDIVSALRGSCGATDDLERCQLMLGGSRWQSSRILFVESVISVITREPVKGN
jgi:hypothetical protein